VFDGFVSLLKVTEEGFDMPKQRPKEDSKRNNDEQKKEETTGSGDRLRGDEKSTLASVCLRNHLKSWHH
jgi:hypothetical protein